MIIPQIESVYRSAKDGLAPSGFWRGGENNYVHDAVSDVYVVFDSAQVKSADPVTYDNNGNVIPLSERFNDSEQDIRYKSRLSAYDAFSELSEEGKNETIDILSRLANGQAIPLKLINNTELFVNAYSQRGELNETININTPQRERLRKEVQKKIENLGSAVKKNNKILYNGDVKREYRADIVIGLPSAGKSSVLVDPLSAVYGSRIVDSDMVKELLPEYNNGLGAGNVHEESKKINERILKHSCENGENIVMPIVGSDANGVIRRINFLKSKGYDVYLHLNELPMYRALGRMITRYIEKGRYLDPSIIYKYQNKPTEVFEQIIKQKGDLLSGYSRYSNDVEYGERPIFKEGTEDYYGAYTRRFEENGSESSRDLRESREGLSGLTTKYQSREDNQFRDFDISDWEFDDTTADTIAREYVSHHEDIGEVLKNIADIDITPAKVTSIVNRVLRENIGNLDKTTRELLSTEVQIALY